MEAARASTPPAPDAAATVAPFRAWRNLRLIVAEEPTRATIDDTGPVIVAKSGGEGGIRTHVGRNAPNRFRVGAVVTASVPLRAGFRRAVGAAAARGGILHECSRSLPCAVDGDGTFAAASASRPSSCCR